MIDPTNSEQVEAVDHRARAVEYLDAVLMPYDEPPSIHVGVANAHATLALVDEVAKLRETIQAMAIPPAQILGRRLSEWAEEETSNE